MSACSLLIGPTNVSFSLRREVLTWSVVLRGQEHVYVHGLLTRDLQSSFFSFRREGVDLEGLSLRERKFDLRESLSVRAFGGRLSGREREKDPLRRRIDKRFGGREESLK